MGCLAFGPSALLVSGFGVFVPPLGQSFGWSSGQIGFAVSLMALTLVVVAPLQGFLIDRFGARRIILVSIPALSGGLAAMSRLPNNLPMFYGAWILLTMLGVGIWPASYLKVASGWFDRHLGIAVGTVNAGIGFGVILVPPIAAAMINAAGWRWAFVGLGALALLTWPVAALFVKEAPLQAGGGITRAMAPWELCGVVRDANFRVIVLGYFLIGVTGTGTVANLIPMLVAGGMTSTQAVAVMSLYGVTALIGRLLTGWLLDRYFVSYVINGAVLAAEAGTLILACGATGAWAIGAAVLLGLILGAEFDVLAYAIRRYFDIGLFGKIYGIAFGSFQAGAATGAAFLAVSVHLTHQYQAGMWMFALVLLVSVPVFSSFKGYAHPAPSSMIGG